MCCTCHIQLDIFAPISLLFSILLWVWALLTTCMEMFHIGVITYLGVFLSSVYLLSPWSRPPHDIAMILVPSTYLINTLPYIVAIIKHIFAAETSEKAPMSYFFVFYCFTVAYVWQRMARLSWKLLKAVKEEDEMNEEKEYLLDYTSGSSATWGEEEDSV